MKKRTYIRTSIDNEHFSENKPIILYVSKKIPSYKSNEFGCNTNWVNYDLDSKYHSSFMLLQMKNSLI